MTNKSAIIATMLSMLAFSDTVSAPGFRFSHKEIVKRGKIVKDKRAGRGKAAKGYDPITGRWIK